MQKPREQPSRFSIARIAGTHHFIEPNDVVAALQAALREVSTSKTGTSYNLKSAQIQTLFDAFYASSMQPYDQTHQICFAYLFLQLRRVERVKERLDLRGLEVVRRAGLGV